MKFFDLRLLILKEILKYSKSYWSDGWNSKALMITSIVLAIGLLLLIIDFALLCCGKCGVTYNIMNCSGYDSYLIQNNSEQILNEIISP